MYASLGSTIIVFLFFVELKTLGFHSIHNL